MSVSILTRFETLPLLQEQLESATGELQKKIKRMVGLTLRKEPTVKEILTSLEEQRAAREKAEVSDNLRELDPNLRHNHLASLPHSIENFTQRAFSLPEDYRLKKKGTKIEDFIAAMVFQPEFISDDCMVGLGYMTEAERKLPVEEKVRKKISIIPELKNLINTLAPINLGPGKDTGRITFVSERQNPNFGKYIVFQEVTDIDEDTDHKKRKIVRKVIPHIYDDHYSLMRGQRYAVTSLEKKITFLSNFRDTIVPDLFMKFASLTLEEKKIEIAKLIEELKGKLSYNEQRALEDRLEKISFRNNGHDRQRLIGACNDIIKELQEKISKNRTIGLQLQWLKEGERSNRRGFEAFYQEFTKLISEMNTVFTGVNPSEMGEHDSLEGIQTKKLIDFWKLAENYHVSLFQTISVLGHPFEDIHNTFSHYLNAFHQYRDASGRKAIGIEGIRITLSFILAIKKIRYHIIMSEVEHYKRVRGTALSYDEKRKLVGKMESIIFSFQHARFLPEVPLTTKGTKVFDTMISALEKAIGELGN